MLRNLRLSRDKLRGLPRRVREVLEESFTELERVTNSVGFAPINTLDSALGTAFNVDLVSSMAQLPWLNDPIDDTISSDTNNYSPTYPTRYIRFNTTSPKKLTGMDPSAWWDGSDDSIWVQITNTGTQPLELPHLSGSSSSGNQFYTPGGHGDSVYLSPGDSALAKYCKPGTPVALPGANTTQSGTINNSTPTITGLTTSSLSTGQAVSGSNIPSGATITSIDSGSQITISQQPTANTTETITFGVGVWLIEVPSCMWRGQTNLQSGTTYSFVESDRGKQVRDQSSSTTNVVYDLPGSPNGLSNCWGCFVYNDPTNGKHTLQITIGGANFGWIASGAGAWVFQTTSGSSGYGMVPVLPYRFCNDVTASTYTTTPDQWNGLIVLDNATGVTVTQPNSSATSGFPKSWYCWFYNKQGTSTVACPSDTINGAASVTLNAGDSLMIVGSAPNYCALIIRSGGGTTPQYKLTIVDNGSSSSPTGSTNFTSQSWTTRIKATVVGPGAGGGGVAGSAGDAAAAGGGSSGGTFTMTWTGLTGGVTYTYNLGGYGTGGAAGNNNGNDGNGDSTFTGPTTITGKAGKGGHGCPAIASPNASAVLGGASPLAGNPGFPGIVIPYGSGGLIAWSGAGGCSTVGGAGGGLVFEGAGVAATANGSGGGGALSLTSGGSSHAGGNGSGGLLVIEEWSF